MSTLRYGMIVEMEVSRPTFVPIFGIALSSSSDKTYPVKFVIEKYWEDDEDPMAYKVKLKPLEEGFGYEKFYSSDLVSLIQKGIVKVIENEV